MRDLGDRGPGRSDWRGEQGIEVVAKTKVVTRAEGSRQFRAAVKRSVRISSRCKGNRSPR